MKCSCNSRKTSKFDVSSSFHIAFLLEGIFFQKDSVCRAQMSPVAKKRVPIVPLKLPLNIQYKEMVFFSLCGIACFY